jgi:malto-oligosyltrehalose synthase/4-alpha-glucanotransferase
MYQPGATYRVQFNKSFTLLHLQAIIPYLHRLGIKTIYASPIFEAVPGSTHGYDGTNPNRINPEIGTWQQLKNISKQLKALDMGWLQDFVPNHMAFSPLNPWLCDVLQKGKMSHYDDYFDKVPDEPLMAPFLSTSLEEALEQDMFQLTYSGGKLCITYSGTDYPLNYSAYSDIIRHDSIYGPQFQAVENAIDRLLQTTVKKDFSKQWDQMETLLAETLQEKSTQKSFAAKLKALSKDTALLRRLLDFQFYRLCHWQETSHRINYRRFFTVNGLICINMQLEHVMDHYHDLLFKMVSEGIIQGIRIDHIDGLYDPAEYLFRLRKKTKAGTYIVVEKILELGEELPGGWPVQGTTGYDFTALISQVQTNRAALKSFTASYPSAPALSMMTSRYKRKILLEHMAGELENLVNTFIAIEGLTIPSPIGIKTLRKLIAAVIVHMPVYRFYPQQLPLKHKDKETFLHLMDILQLKTRFDQSAISFFKNCFLEAGKTAATSYAQQLLHFWRRCMQLSGPLMAKGIEDTLMYNMNRFIALNEVGNNPFLFGMTVRAFHRLMEQRADQFPYTLNATATHDTKRGEDARARLISMSLDPQSWQTLSASVLQAKDKHYTKLTGKDKYFVLQVLASTLPAADQDNIDYRQRLGEYLVKAAREAKTLSSWEKPDSDYEALLTAYAFSLTGDGKTSGMLQRFVQQQQSAAWKSSLAQLVLKCTCPGIPDIYQGTEYPDYSFVDPDNRRAVDYTSRMAVVTKLSPTQVQPLPSCTNEGKLAALYYLLQLRKKYPDLFASGSYEPVTAPDHCLCFVRRYQNTWLWVLVALSPQHRLKRIQLPPEAPQLWQELFSDRTINPAEPDNWLDILENNGLLVAWAQREPKTRKAGVLMPLFSLQGNGPAGDMGTAGKDFISFLSRSRQSIWQLLPLHPVSQEQSYSPYATASAFAGDIRYIAAEGLEEDDLLTRNDIQSSQRLTGSVDYEKAFKSRQDMLQKAWKRFREMQPGKLHYAYEQFRKEESWPKDYALYVTLKQRFGQQPWYRWPDAFRNRHPKSMDSLQHEEVFEQQLWFQFIFQRQWMRLRERSRQQGIRLMGDIPFYMSVDSADVWSHRHIFNINPDGSIRGIAGVPPDYFSETGQLWHMPTYNWAAQEKDGFSWWLQRLARNLDLYDLVRLDHFRAFYDYWEVPGDAATAREGKWLHGPSDKLFSLIRERFPTMPFVAEDLGELHEGVFDFMDRYRLPGMRVLQFGFDPYLPASRDLPHNFPAHTIAYTGTHDNNTSLGWFRTLSRETKARLSYYAGYTVTEANVAHTLCRLVYGSVAATAILPMQDLLGLGERSRINTPATSGSNWLWRLPAGSITESLSTQLRIWSEQYNR